MKIFTKTKKQSIENRLCNTITDYAVEDREIMTITLDYDEYLEFKEFWSKASLPGYNGNREYTFMGVEIKPNRDARRRLNEEEKNKRAKAFLDATNLMPGPMVWVESDPPGPSPFNEVRCVQIGDDIDPWTLPSGCYTAFWNGQRRQIERHANDFFILTDDPIRVWVRVHPTDVRRIKHWLFWPDKDYRCKP